MRTLLTYIFTILVLTSCDRKTGEYIEYFSNGDTLSIYNYQNGKLDGSYKTYYPKNKLKDIGQYVDGNKLGVHKEYYENGAIKKYLYYKYALEVPVYGKEYDEHGNITTSAIHVGNHNRMSQDTIDANKPFRIGYHLDYSMYEQPRLSLTIVKKVDNGYENIVNMGSDTTIVEYDLNISKGWNHFIVELGEYTATNDTLKGLQIQELKYFGK